MVMRHSSFRSDAEGYEMWDTPFELGLPSKTL
jgi:hypothetical protein